MEVPGFTIRQTSETCAYLEVPKDYRAKSVMGYSGPDLQVIRVKPGLALMGLRQSDLTPWFKASTKPEHQCFRTYFPLLTLRRYVEVDHAYKGPEPVYALESDIAVYNGSKVICIPLNGEKYHDELPLTVAWQVVRVDKPRRMVWQRQQPSLLKKVLEKGARVHPYPGKC
jgi:hypothetical protein